MRESDQAGPLTLEVSLESQALRLIDAGREIARYPVSTARNGPSCAEGSGGTPTGWHAVVERYGEGAPAGTVFRDRLPTGEIVDPAAASDGRDLILSRILRLAGEETGHNRGPGVDSYERFIYIHGTNREDRIGTPASAGCVRMRNADIIDLFERVKGRPVRCHIG
jgi:lipoprotein-anchoring transpeptidase ErfK/SrfK